MNKTVIGKFIPGNTIIYKFDPRVKLLINICLIVLVFLTNKLVMLGVILLPVLLAYLFSGLKKSLLLRAFKPVIGIGIFIFIINLFILRATGDQTTSDYVVYFEWWKLQFSNKAIKLTLLIMIRIYIMILTTTLLTATTPPMALTRAIEDILWPLKLIKIKVNVIALIISIALRFIPTLLEEAQRIMKAQSSRGVDFQHGNLKTKAKSIVTLIIPLFVSAFAKAEDLANAMETRGYDPYQKRTRYRSYVFAYYDYLLIVFYIAMIMLIFFNNYGWFNIPVWVN